ncbi:MAG: hypothetical protein ACRD00_01365 [Thermoanaerobaculia bacterium]
MSLAAAAAGLAAALLALLAIVHLLLARAQDRFARDAIAREPEAWKLLTRADLVAGRYRRLPGLLGLKEGQLEFWGLYGESILVPTSRIQKIATGSRLASGRLLWRMEVLRITRGGGDDLEFVLTRPAVFAWRSHLGLWAMAERQADADRVTPGRQ